MSAMPARPSRVCATTQTGEVLAALGLHCLRLPAAHRCFSRRISFEVSPCSDESPVRPAVPSEANGDCELVVLRQLGTVHFSRSGRPAVPSGRLDATPCPIDTGAPRLPAPAQREPPGAGNGGTRLRWTLRRLWSVRCLTYPRFPRLEARGAGHFAPPAALPTVLGPSKPRRRFSTCRSLPCGPPPSLACPVGRACAPGLRLNALPHMCDFLAMRPPDSPVRCPFGPTDRDSTPAGRRGSRVDWLPPDRTNGNAHQPSR